MLCCSKHVTKNAWPKTKDLRLAPPPHAQSAVKRSAILPSNKPPINSIHSRNINNLLRSPLKTSAAKNRPHAFSIFVAHATPLSGSRNSSPNPSQNQKNTRTCELKPPKLLRLNMDDLKKR